MKRILAAALAAVMLPVFPCAFADGLYSESFDMTKEKADGENGIVLSQEVPDGDYKVTVTTGGDTETKANIYINGGERVRAYTLEAGKTQENEQPVVPKDGKIEVQVLGENPNVTEIKIEQLENRTEPGEKPTIYIAGDSTAQTYDYSKVYPQIGWGQVFGDYLTDDVVVENRSMGGRSSKSYNNDGRLDRILTEMYPGDYVFIQFGINDGAENKPERYISVPDYKELITNKYIGEVKKRGGIPVLLTATAAGWWDEENSCFMESRQDYAVPTREIADETGVEFIDINKIMTDTWNQMGKDDVLSRYFICEPLESKAYPAGTNDQTHLKENGARAVAGMVAYALHYTDLEMYVKPMYIEFTDIDGHWAENTIKRFAMAVNRNAITNILDGVGGGKFEPDRNVTRAEFLKMIMKMLNIPGHAYRDGECLDAVPEDWFRFYLQSALDKGLIPPEMLGDCVGTKIVEKVIEEATEEKEAVTAEITVYEFTGDYDTNKGRLEMKFDGNKPITREEMTALLMNCVSYKLEDPQMEDLRMQIEDLRMQREEKTFTDTADISPEYLGAVELAASYGVVNGMEDGSFRPKENLTRAQAVKIIAG